MDSSRPVDVVVIGSGIGGLSTAILLAKSGFTVTVLEKNRHPGGMMRGYTRKGLECPVGVHYLGALGSGQILRRFFDFLGVSSEIAVERMGRAGVIDRYIFNDLTFDLPEGLGAYEANLRAAFPDQQLQITGIMQLLRQAEQHLNSLDFLFSDEMGFAQPEQFQAIGDIMTRLGCSAELKGVLGVPSCWIGVPPDQCPAFYHNTALASYLMSSWRVKKGVSMVDAFVKRLETLGGRVLCGDGVESILVESRRVRGVRLVSGTEIEAPVVVGAVHPKVVLAMLPDAAVRPLYRKRISGLKDTHSIMCVHAQLDAAAHPEVSHNIFKIDRDKNGHIPDLRYYQLRSQGEKSVLSILTSGKVEFWRKWENTRTGKRGRDYMEAKEEQAQNLLLEAGKIFGPLKDCRLLDVYTPLTIRDWVNSPGGSAYGVLRSCDQLLSASLLNRSSVEGLFLAGQSVMAPGVIGTVMGSFQTTKFILGPERFREEIALPFKD
ncbi:MAG: NAD(P)/FAD-dependent oxidoreductase [Desulfobacterales bacterium]|nr:NAD(P)/FAD-dependent oxidoreductase [Desulfobacterales bacterium]